MSTMIRRQGELLEELEELAERGRRLLEQLESMGQSQVQEYLERVVINLEAAREALTTPQGALEAWTERFQKEALAEAEGPTVPAPDAWVVLTPKTAKKVLTKGRVALLSLLARPDSSIESISELARLMEKPLEVVSRDLKVLRNFGFIELRREGRRKKPILLTKNVFLQMPGPGKPRRGRGPKRRGNGDEERGPCSG